MLQRFIELGEGYGDLFELCELIGTNKHRLYRTFIFKINRPEETVYSAAAAFNSAGESKFMPIYICREGIPENSKRLSIFMESAKRAGNDPVEVEVKPSIFFAEKGLYYHYLTGVLRLNNLLPPMK